MVQNTTETPIRRRGRPRVYNPEVALREAGETFWRQGYAATSLDDVSAATGMNRPSLFAAFGDKHTLYIKALRAYWDLKFAMMREALEGGTLKESLLRVYDESLSIYISGKDGALGCFVVGTAITEAPEDTEVRSIVLEGLQKLDAYFEARIRSARDADELREGTDIKALAMVASATLHTLAVRARVGVSKDELKQLARKAVKLICT